MTPLVCTLNKDKGDKDDNRQAWEDYDENNELDILDKAPRRLIVSPDSLELDSLESHSWAGFS